MSCDLEPFDWACSRTAQCGRPIHGGYQLLHLSAITVNISAKLQTSCSCFATMTHRIPSLPRLSVIMLHRLPQHTCTGRVGAEAPSKAPGFGVFLTWSSHQHRNNKNGSVSDLCFLQRELVWSALLTRCLRWR